MLSKEQSDRQDFDVWHHNWLRNQTGIGSYDDSKQDMWKAWKARSAELLSLREQLAALKALEPFCHVFLHPDGPLFNGIVSDSCAGHAGVIPLFTAAKPAED